MKLFLIAPLIFLVPFAAQASGGAIEINQACISNGCFGGDGPGYPVEIDQPGSYILTSDLVPTPLNTLESVIRIQASSVTLDLGGHSIRGPVICIGDGPTCFAGNTDYGIKVDSPDINQLSDVELRNGTVTGFDRNCIESPDTANVVVRDMRISNCGNIGVFLLGVGGGRLERISVSNCGNRGAFVGPDFLVSHSTFTNNSELGLSGGSCVGNSFSDNDGTPTPNEEACSVQLGPNACNGAPCP